MKEHFQLTVADIFKRKHFEQALVIAGNEGNRGLSNGFMWLRLQVFEIY